MNGSREMQDAELAEIFAAESYARAEAQADDYEREREYHASAEGAGVDPCVVVEEQSMVDLEGWHVVEGQYFESLSKAAMRRRIVAECRVAGRVQS